MIKSYIKMAFRNLSRNKLTSYINIFGLSAAIGCSIVAFLFVDFYYNRDTFHENAEQIFLIENIITEKEAEQIWGNSPVPLGPALKTDFPQIKRAVRINEGNGIIRYQDKIFDEYVQFVDEEFLKMFTFPLKYGNKNALSDKNALVISEETAQKYFGDENPINKQVTITFNGRYKESFLIRGVTEKLPKNSSFKFEILIPYKKQLNLGIKDFNDWSLLTDATFIQLNNPEDINIIKAQVKKYIELQNAANFERPMSDFVFEPLLKIAQNSHKVRRNIVWVTLYPGQVFSLFFSGLFLLLLACFNYMNIAIVSAAKRFKEIGIRKVIGSNRHNLIAQFIGENIVSCLIALIIGVALAEFFFVPGFNSLYGVFEFEVDLYGNIRLWGYLIAVLLLSGVGAGAYPAFYISAYQPANIFRGKQKFSGNTLFTKILLTFQFVLSFIAITNGIIFIQNNEYQKERDWGYNQEQLIAVPIHGKSQFIKLKNAIAHHPNILNTAGSRHHIGWFSERSGVEIEEKKYEVAKFDIGFNYFETMGLKLKQGRAFKKDMITDIESAIIVNETFVKNMNWEDALSKRILYENQPYYIIGVIEDFHHQNFMKKIDPTVLRVVSEDEFNFLTISVKSGTAIETMEYIKNTWTTLIPDAPYPGFFQDSIFSGYYQAMVGTAKASSVIALIALIIVCMGIFGMVSMNLMKRMKEISIHKILGASVSNVIRLVNKGFFSLLVVATIIAIPTSYYILKLFLDSLWEYHKALDPIPFVFAFGIILFSIVLTMSSQIYKALMANPVDTLRDE